MNALQALNFEKVTSTAGDFIAAHQMEFTFVMSFVLIGIAFLVGLAVAGLARDLIKLLQGDKSASKSRMATFAVLIVITAVNLDCNAVVSLLIKQADMLNYDLIIFIAYGTLSLVVITSIIAMMWTMINVVRFLSDNSLVSNLDTVFNVVFILLAINSALLFTNYIVQESLNNRVDFLGLYVEVYDEVVLTETPTELKYINCSTTIDAALCESLKPYVQVVQDKGVIISDNSTMIEVMNTLSKHFTDYDINTATGGSCETAKVDAAPV